MTRIEQYKHQYGIGKMMYLKFSKLIFFLLPIKKYYKTMNDPTPTYTVIIFFILF